MKRLLSPWFALLTLALLVGIRASDPSFVQSVRLRYFDTLITSKPQTVSKQVHVVNIDDKSIERLGQFPFPRSQYANIIEDLYHRHAGLVVFNIFMPDSDRFGRDANLVDSLAGHPVVLPQVASTDKQVRQAFRPGVSEIGSPAHDFTIDYPGIQPNIELFNNKAAGIGVVNVLPEIDGVVRRIPMVVSSGGLLYPKYYSRNFACRSRRPKFPSQIFRFRNRSCSNPKLLQNYNRPNRSYLGRLELDSN